MTLRRSIACGLALVGLVAACTGSDPAAQVGVNRPSDPEARVNVAPPKTAAGAHESPLPVTCADPPCPLFDWMETQMEQALVGSNYEALASQFDSVAARAPAGYANWTAIARDGADAARVGLPLAVRAACRTCHEQYRARYARELRSRPL